MASPAGTTPAAEQAAPRQLELAIARLLNVGVITSIALLAIGVVLAIAAGVSPVDAGLPPFDLARIPADILALRPEGFLWLGLVFVMLTPASRVVASAVGFSMTREWLMVLISIAVLIVIATGVILSVVEV
jgi:uncharacterized membrane protein